MPAATFDTQAANDALRAAGVGEAQAKATVAMVRDAVSEGVATKTDIESLKADHGRLEEKINGLAGNMKAQTMLIGGVFITVLGAAIGVPIAVLS